MNPKEFLEKLLEMGVSPQNQDFVNLAKDTVSKLDKYKDYKTIDYGAGTGVYANELALAGFDVVAQDIWKENRDYIQENYEYFSQPRKTITKPTKSDLMIFIEVAEHMTDSEIKKAIKSIDPKIILFSSTSKKSDEDEEWGHINLKSQKDWLSFWKKLGFNKINDLEVPTEWTILLEKI